METRAAGRKEWLAEGKIHSVTCGCVGRAATFSYREGTDGHPRLPAVGRHHGLVPWPLASLLEVRGRP